MKTCIVVMICLFTTMLFYTSSAQAENLATDSSNNAALRKAKALVMRLDIINATDISELTKKEKRTLRKETRYIKGNLKELRGGRYVRTSLLVLLLLVPVSVFQLSE
jgi:hypothetical protein